MKILFAIHHFPPDFSGGAEITTFRVARGLQKRGHSVRVVCVRKIDSGPLDGVFVEEDVYEGIPVERLSFDLNKAPDRFHWDYENPWVAAHMEKAIQQFSPDIFMLTSGYLLTSIGLRIARQYNIPSVAFLTDYWFICPRITKQRSNGVICPADITPVDCVQCLAEERRRFRIPGKVLPGLMRSYWKTQISARKKIEERNSTVLPDLQKTDLINIESQFLAGLIRKAGVLPEKIRVSRQGVDLSQFDLTSFSKQPSETLRIGYIGQITPHKGLHILIKAFKLIIDPNIHLKIYGNPAPFPDYHQDLKKLIGEDKRIEWAGAFKPSQLDKVYEDLDVVVIPSIWYENSPNVIVETLAFQTPLIGSRIGGIPELIQSGVNGLLFEPGNEVELARMINSFRQDPHLLTRLREGIKAVKTTEQEIEEFEKCLISLQRGR